MFYGQCNDCGQRWAIGTANTCTCEEDEFNRIELEASLRKAAVQATVGKGITLNISEPIESNITFMTSAGKEVMRIDKNGVKINPDFPLDEAAQHVINALDGYIRGLVQSEREACAYRAGIALLGADRGLSNRVDQAIRARGNT